MVKGRSFTPTDKTKWAVFVGGTEQMKKRGALLFFQRKSDAETWGKKLTPLARKRFGKVSIKRIKNR